MATLLQEIEEQIAGVKATTTKQNVGTVREIGDGVAKVDGLSRAKLNEMLDFGHGVTGLALNLEETEVGAIILGDYTQIDEGDEVRSTGKLLQVPVGKGLLGRVVNMLGQPIDGKGPIQSEASYPVEKVAPGIIRREPVRQAVQTGIMPIDAMIPIGRGQRELIIGEGIPPAVLHLRGDRPEAIQRRSSHWRAGRSGRDALHHRPGLPGLRFRRQPVYGALCRGGDGGMVYGQRDGRLDRF
jgi:hypothetical protein